MRSGCRYGARRGGFDKQVAETSVEEVSDVLSRPPGVRIDGKNVFVKGRSARLDAPNLCGWPLPAQGCFFSTDQVTKTARHLLWK